MALGGGMNMFLGARRLALAVGVFVLFLCIDFALGGKYMPAFLILIAYVGFVWTVGWIVRGFMGIPHGMDKRPD